jgi:hypothetical protein
MLCGAHAAIESCQYNAAGLDHSVDDAKVLVEHGYFTSSIFVIVKYLLMRSGSNFTLSPAFTAFSMSGSEARKTMVVPVFRDPLSALMTFLRALWLGIALWLFVLVFFFPVVGWGFLALAVSPKLIVGAAIPHLLFAVFLWGLCRLAFGTPHAQVIKT